MDITIRPANPSDAKLLTKISFASKRYWDYPEHYFQIWNDELTITPSYTEKNRVFIAEEGEKPIGYYSLVEVDHDIKAGNVFVPKGHWLEHMFILPSYIGKGIGRKLMQHAMDHGLSQGWKHLFIFADPNARGFYDKMGAIYIKDTPSSIAGRSVSLYTLPLKTEHFPLKSGNFIIDHLPRHPEFVPTVARWIYDEFVDSTLWTFDQITAKFTECHLDKLPMTWIALDQGQCVGTVSLFQNDLKPRPDLTPWLAALYVKPESRGSGVAARLIESVIAESRRLEYDTLYLRTEHTAEYYRQRGWRFLETTHDTNGQETKIFSYVLS